MVRKFEFWHPFVLEDPHILIPPKFAKNYLIFMIVTPKNYFFLSVWLKTFEFWRPRLGETFHFRTPKFGQILSFFYTLLP